MASISARTGVGKALLAWLEPAALEAALNRQAFHRYTATTLGSSEALRADLAEIRARGVSFDREEHERGIICLAAPILSEAGRLLGALSITQSTERQDLAALGAQAPTLREAASAIARDAEAWLFPELPARTQPQEPSRCRV